MIDTRAVMRSLPLVASVLGRKYGVKVEIGGTDAYTDGTVIRLPSLPSDVPDTLLVLARGFLDHEASHVRDTDFKVLKDANLTSLEMHVWNTIEDWRVEHKLASIFPGCRQNFDWLIAHIFGSEQRDEPVPPAVNILNWLLLEVRSWDVLALSTQRDILAAQMDLAFPGVRPRIERVLTSVRGRCNSTQDAIGFAREIVRILDQFANPSTRSEPIDHADPKEQQFQGEGNLSASTSSDSGKPCNDQQRQENTSETEGNFSDEDAQEGSPVEDYSPSKNQENSSRDDRLDDLGEIGEEARDRLLDLLGAGEDDLPQSLGDILADALQVNSSRSKESAVTVAVPMTKNAGLLSEDDVLEAKQASIALRTRLQGLLQTKILSRASSGRRGRLDTGQLHRLTVSDPRVFRVKAERAGIDTAVHILLDCSGSMVRRIRLACLACYAVGSALDASKINVAVTAFPSSQLPNGSYSTVAPIIVHGQKVHIGLDLTPAGGTPMGEALWWVMQNMLPLSERRKLILIVTDGEPDSVECANQAIEQGRMAGFEIYGIGITSASINALLPGRSVIVNAMPDLATAMFTLLENAVLRR